MAVYNNIVLYLKMEQYFNSLCLSCTGSHNTSTQSLTFANVKLFRIVHTQTVQEMDQCCQEDKYVPELMRVELYQRVTTEKNMECKNKPVDQTFAAQTALECGQCKRLHRSDRAHTLQKWGPDVQKSSQSRCNLLKNWSKYEPLVQIRMLLYRKMQEFCKCGTPRWKTMESSHRPHMSGTTQK